MTKIGKFLGLLALIVALPIGALAREGVPIIEHNDILISTGSGKPATADQVRDAIITAAGLRNWEVTRNATQNSLTATLNVKGRHSVAVAIPYSAETFSVKYLNSVNMNYRLSEEKSAETSSDLTKVNAPAAAIKPGTPLIHPSYNRWVQDLMRGIQFELKKL
ncbi:MAG TPA: hypothetical protein VFF03_14620 [Rhodocyclaceae bacterium]|nr:hypothetical protein [Rhodocyclaceae bacterium]